MSNISALGLQLVMTANLQNQQADLSKLNEQLASSKLNSNLTDYAPLAAHQLLNLQNAIAQKQSYLSSMQTVTTRLTIYDSTLSDMEDIASQANSLASQNQNYDATKVDQIKAQVLTYLKQVTDDLNQKLGDRYLYSGIRYSTKPVVDLTTLTGTPSATPAVNPDLPDYDADFVASAMPASNDANAYVSDTVLVDSSYTVNYGITSVDPAFQKLIAGLRFISEAVDAGNTPAYQTNMTQAASLLSGALNDIQGLHSGVANSQNVLQQKTSTQNNAITALQNQLTDIQSVDLTEVGIKINLLQTQMQASYSATATLGKLSLVNYL